MFKCFSTNKMSSEPKNIEKSDPHGKISSFESKACSLVKPVLFYYNGYEYHFKAKS